MSETYTIILDAETGLQYKTKQDVVLKSEKNNDSQIEMSDCNREDSSDEERNTRTSYIWRYEQVVELIKSINTHYDDLNNPRTRKQAFEQVANDLINKDIQVTSAMIQSKWHGLLKSYRKAKENLNKKGQGCSRFNFFDLMDKLVGSNPPKPRSRPVHSTESDPIEHVDIIVSMEESSASENTKANKKSSPKRYQQRLKREYMQWKTEELKRKQKRHKDKMKLEEAKLELEERKIALLERYLKLK